MKPSDLEPLSGEAQRLLSIERELPREPEDFRARALGRARAALRAEDAAARRGFLKHRSRLLLAAALSVAFTAVAFAALRQRDAGTSAGPNAAPSATAGAPAMPKPAAPAPEAAPAASERATTPAPSPLAGSAAVPAPRSAPSVDESALELVSLQRARAALARGEHSTALAALSEHQQRFPAGRLVEEREALRIKALLGLGRNDEARRAAERFRVRFPRSVLLPRIDEAVRR